MSTSPLDQLRAICLALPEATEKLTWGEHPTFRVRDKIFVMYSEGIEHRPRLDCKAQPGIQAMLVGAEPQRFLVPPYVGHKGWIGIWLDGAVDWQHVTELVEESYRMTAPKRLQALLDQPKPAG